jgi:hypothetical protein
MFSWGDPTRITLVIHDLKLAYRRLRKAPAFARNAGVEPLVEAQLHEVQARDPVTLAAAAFTVIAAAVLTAYLPARYASRVDPIAVLRAE